jgi:hypothetical protein
MSQPENIVPESRTSGLSENAELRQQCQDLRRQVSMLLLTFMMASFTLTAYLGLQNIRAGRDLKNVRQLRTQLAEQTKMELAGVQAFVSKLGEYGQTHADFQPILTKYQIRMVTNAPPAPALTPATPAAPPKK